MPGRKMGAVMLGLIPTPERALPATMNQSDYSYADM
jgi:hypothetical protein